VGKIRFIESLLGLEMGLQSFDKPEELGHGEFYKD
jgi:hypothetical protein